MDFPSALCGVSERDLVEFNTAAECGGGAGHTDAVDSICGGCEFSCYSSLVLTADVVMKDYFIGIVVKLNVDTNVYPAAEASVRGNLDGLKHYTVPTGDLHGCLAADCVGRIDSEERICDAPFGRPLSSCGAGVNKVEVKGVCGKSVNLEGCKSYGISRGREAAYNGCSSGDPKLDVSKLTCLVDKLDRKSVV